MSILEGEILPAKTKAEIDFVASFLKSESIQKGFKVFIYICIL